MRQTVEWNPPVSDSLVYRELWRPRRYLIGMQLKFACVQPALFLAVATVLLPLSSIAQGQRGPLTLCQLFQDLDSHAGQRVTLRAAFRYGFELSGLYTEACKPRQY
jgi:hypothetical protein